MTDTLLFVALPYVALCLFLGGSIHRYVTGGYTVSSLSSQFLESNRLYWGSLAFHGGILALVAGHLLGFLFPAAIGSLTRHPVGRFAVEMTGLTMGLVALVGITALILRRLLSNSLRVVTTTMDYVVFSLILLQVVLGVLVAIQHRWGTAWYTSTLVPYLQSILTFRPDLKLVIPMPFLIKFHVAAAFVIVAMVPFTRLMHILVAPMPYLWRAVQIAIWYRKPGGSAAKSGQ